MTPAEWVERIDAELADNEAERGPADPSIEVLADLGRIEVALGANCRRACPTRDHRSFGECVRAADLHIDKDSLR